MPTTTKPTPLAVTGDPAADALLRTNPLALLIGMLLDQQVPMEWAFVGPLRLTERLDGDLDAAAIAAMDIEELIDVFRIKPALHRYPKSMAQRVQQLCQHIVDNYDGDAAKVWKGVRSGDTLHERLVGLPGYGQEKASIFTALLAKRFGVRPHGWETHAGPFADTKMRSVADIDGPEALEQVRHHKKMLKAKGKGKAG
ncbi:MAG TPA: HhH-GPD-type base excision DNA repair protein [Acidimicrobiales bacterium]|jgi:uncharacterized HhH-GPD family protein